MGGNLCRPSLMILSGLKVTYDQLKLTKNRWGYQQGRWRQHFGSPWPPMMAENKTRKRFEGGIFYQLHTLKTKVRRSIVNQDCLALQNNITVGICCYLISFVVLICRVLKIQVNKKHMAPEGAFFGRRCVFVQEYLFLASDSKGQCNVMMILSSSCQWTCRPLNKRSYI